MKVLRSVAAILVGVFVATVVVGVSINVGHLVYPPPEELRDPDNVKKVLADPEELHRVIAGLSLGSLLSVLLAVQAGAVIGGATAALIAARGRIIHAGVIGAYILFASVGEMMMIPPPVWMKIAALLLPLPLSLLAGKVVSLIFDSHAESPPPPSDP